MNEKSIPPLPTSRRQFLKTSSAAALGGIVAANLSFPEKTFAQNSDTIRVGLIGCGGRGTGAAREALNADKNAILTAVADVFPDKIKGSLATLKNVPGLGDKVNVDPGSSFIGFDAYQKVIDSGVDLVILTTPPGFRPQHLKAAIDAGKHVFCEKPMATDAPGLRSVLASVEEAKKRKLALVAGFCWRYHSSRREFFKQIHDGAIGDIRAIYATYYTSPVKPMPAANTRRPGVTDLEWQLRNWYNFVWLCGDGLVEQAVHSIDKVAWAMKDVPPLKAVAVGGRQTPNNEGNIYDHFEINYEYAAGVRAFLGCRQQNNCYSETRDYLMGTKGLGNIGGRRAEVEITGEKSWHYEGPRPLDMYQVEHNELFASIRAGKPINDGARMCSSTLMGLMGRMAAYTGQEVTWEQALESTEILVPEKLYWNMNLPIAPMAIPGRTRLG
jgi:myo-inositol 2-dehydrogenase/D-chiro-inositol 1-dehydrogenase